MKHLARLGLGGSLLFSLCACGGSEEETPLAPLPATAASAWVGAFLLIEANPSTPATLPSWKTRPGSSALHLAAGKLESGCTSSETLQNPDGSTTIKVTFACSSPVDGSTLSGSLAFTFTASNPGAFRVDYKEFKRVKDTQSWTVNGSKEILLNPAVSRALLTTPAPLTVSFLDTAHPEATRTYSYGCILVADWGTANAYKVWGSFSFQSGNEATLSGAISELHPLAWTPGCCHPTSGILTLTQGRATGEVRFALPCGSYTLSGNPSLNPLTLPDCPE